MEYQYWWWSLRKAVGSTVSSTHIPICTYWKYHFSEFLIYEGRERLQINSKSKIPGLSLFLFLILWNSFEYRAVFVIPQTNICMKVTWSYKHEAPKDKNDFTFPSFLQGIVRIADSRDVFNQKHKPSFLANENQKM